MTRIVKDPDERRSELITTAQQLFFTKGYERTSISDIVKTVGVAHGTFYYYFESKAIILEAIVKQMVEQIITKLQEIITEESITAIPKWQKTVHLSNNWKIERKAEIIEANRLLYKDENILLRHKIRSETLKVVANEMTKIIAQGVDEAIFDVDNASETAIIMMTIIASFSDAVNEIIFNPDKYEDPITAAMQKSAAVQTAVERLLGAPAGSMPIIDKKILSAWFTD